MALQLCILFLLAVTFQNCKSEEVEGTRSSSYYSLVSDKTQPSLLEDGVIGEPQGSSVLSGVQPNPKAAAGNQFPHDGNTTVFCRTTDATCPPWFVSVKENGSVVGCKCGDSLGNVVQCRRSSRNNCCEAYLLHCYCMTYNEDTNTTVVGHCLHTCLAETNVRQWYSQLPGDPMQLDDAMCGKYNRTGQLCGECRDGFAPPVYSFQLSCVECPEHTNNWLKYIAISFGPLTVFFVIVLVFRISVPSAPLNVFVFATQIAGAPQIMRVVASLPRGTQYTLLSIAASLAGIWNLDFFRTVYTPFCLHPNMTDVQALALDYMVAVYPLILIGIVFILVILHDNGFRVILWAWKPFHKCLSRFRRKWNIRTSLIDALASFLLLSSMKFISVSFNLLVPTQLFLKNGKTVGRPYLFYDGTVEMFSEEHRPYAILAVTVLLVFIILPLLLLCLYPCRWFQKCINFCGFRCFGLRAFMDVFQGCYKDGTNNTMDCRYFAGMYLFVRFVLFVIYASTLAIFFSILALIVLIIVAFLVASMHPNKNALQNSLDILLILTLVIFNVGILGTFSTVQPNFWKLSVAIIAISGSVLILYEVALALYQILAWHRCMKRPTILHGLCCFDSNRNTSVEPLPYRMENSDEHAALLNKPGQGRK